MRIIFVIDTDEYAGNFEREMTAYMTGQSGECGVGQDTAKVFNEEVGEGCFDNLVISQPDDHNGYYRPTTIWDTPGWFNDGWGGHFRDGEEEAAEKHYRQECSKEENKNHPRVKNEEPMQKYPFYGSVAIFMSKEPTEAEIAILIDRARAYSAYAATQRFMKSGNILGFRLIKEETIQTEIKNWDI